MDAKQEALSLSLSMLSGFCVFCNYCTKSMPYFHLLLRYKPITEILQRKRAFTYYSITHFYILKWSGATYSCHGCTSYALINVLSFLYALPRCISLGFDTDQKQNSMNMSQCLLLNHTPVEFLDDLWHILMNMVPYALPRHTSVESWSSCE